MLAPYIVYHICSKMSNSDKYCRNACTFEEAKAAAIADGLKVTELGEAAEVGARVSQAEIIKLADNVKAAKKNVETIKAKWDAVEGATAIEAFYQKSVKPAEVEVLLGREEREGSVSVKLSF